MVRSAREFLPGAQRVRRLALEHRRSGGFLPCFLLSFALLLGHKLFAQLAVGGEGRRSITRNDSS